MANPFKYESLPMQQVFWLYDFRWNLVTKGTLSELSEVINYAPPTILKVLNKNRRIGGVGGYYLRSKEVDLETQVKYHSEV